MAQKYLERLSAFIEKATSGYSVGINLQCKHFFSGAALYADERICISFTPVGLAMKLPEETKDRLLKKKKVRPLRYFSKGPIKKGFVLFPAGIEGGGKVLQRDARESIEYALTLPKPKKKKNK